ncbi:NifU family protein [Goodfellowiella coeruleoviolacea]|uniref:NifU-like domain-containing protein n=1 Tax=Goodfellowiella coeruleoviolacea TaxID=334858 RepID=A0AAE3GC83_9PSEU|nr:NifU family protein [Goodfellowiella coeruleoviolacea]MCP2163498.1 NifU-like domain-containing protein [Goodfellowiella coeruleoviolacea]
MTWDAQRLRAHVGQVEQLLTQVGEHQDTPAGRIAAQAVQALVDLYGEALARVVALAARAGFGAELTGDELLEHLLLVHELHPDPVETRVRRVVGELNAELRARGAVVELVEVRPDVVTVRLTTSGCASTGHALASTVEDAVLRVAPEVGRVETVAPRAEPVLVPVAELLRPAARRDG